MLGTRSIVYPPGRRGGGRGRGDTHRQLYTGGVVWVGPATLNCNAGDFRSGSEGEVRGKDEGEEEEEEEEEEDEEEEEQRR